jgi:carboxypeptidase Taq
MKSLDIIYSIQKEISTLRGISGLLDWDLQTYMPKGSAKDRAEQIALISKKIHEKITSAELKKSIEDLVKPENFSKLEKKDRIVVERLKKDVEKMSKLPTEFVEELSMVTGLAHNAWEEAKKKSDFSIFQPHLEKIVELEIKQASYLGLPGHPYNGLIDLFEEGMTAEVLTEKFKKLKAGLVKLLKEIKNSKTYKSRKNMEKSKFPIESQRMFSKDVMKLIGLSESRSRIDESVHPFTTETGANDVRITTRYKEENPLFAFSSTVHEAGHALYQLDLPEEYNDTVVFRGASFGLHESQSRFWENMIAKNILFWKYYFKFFKKAFNKQLKNTSLEQWYRYDNDVKPSLIRIEADEVTYCLHIILRFEIEMGLIEGSIKVKDLPKIWNKKMKELVGVEPKNDSEGVLQDVHWSGGAFGYFPSYAIGTIYAAQLFDTLSKKHPKIKGQIQKGDFSTITKWLKENVHKYGRSLNADDIIKKACGEGLNIDVYIQYLRKKYLEIYK